MGRRRSSSVWGRYAQQGRPQLFGLFLPLCLGRLRSEGRAGGKDSERGGGWTGLRRPTIGGMRTSLTRTEFIHHYVHLQMKRGAFKDQTGTASEDLTQDLKTAAAKLRAGMGSVRCSSTRVSVSPTPKLSTQLRRSTPL